MEEKDRDNFVKTLTLSFLLLLFMLRGHALIWVYIELAEMQIPSFNFCQLLLISCRDLYFIQTLQLFSRSEFQRVDGRNEGGKIKKTMGSSLRTIGLIIFMDRRSKGFWCVIAQCGLEVFGIVHHQDNLMCTTCHHIK